MRKIRFDRLLKLAKHLASGKLGHKLFDFGQYNDGDWSCGSAGCAIGECPIAFPDDWEFREWGVVALNGAPLDLVEDTSFYSAKKFFGLTDSQAQHLFVPTVPWEMIDDKPRLRQNVKKFGGKVLFEEATRKEVAANIRAFVRIMKKAKKS
jgi:hypothetical protein